MNWLWIGDSHLEAMHSRIRDLSAERGIGGLVSYRRGWSSGRWLRDGDVASLLARAKPNIVVYALGANDDPIDPRPIVALADLARAADARVIWFGPFHTTAHDEEFRAVLGDSYVSGAAMAKGLRFPAGNVHLVSDDYPILAARLVDYAVAPPRLTKLGLLVLGGCALTAVGLLAVGSTPAMRRRWTPAEPHPFDRRAWNTQRAPRKVSPTRKRRVR